MDPQSLALEVVTFQLSVDEMGVEGLTEPMQSEDAEPAIIHKEGKRHIFLDNIRAFLISEANVFSSLARSPSMPSSEAARSPTMTNSRPPSRQPSDLAMSSTSDHPASPDGLAQSHYALQDSEDAFNIPYDLDGQNDDDENDEPQSPLSTPRASVYQDFGSSSPELHAQSAVIEPEPAPWASFSREAQSEPYFHQAESYMPQPRTPSPMLSHHSSPASSRSSSGPHVSEDLAQSHLYSHEDAESMYMSAFSQAQASELRRSMPGSWLDEHHSPGIPPAFELAGSHIAVSHSSESTSRSTRRLIVRSPADEPSY